MRSSSRQPFQSLPPGPSDQFDAQILGPCVELKLGSAAAMAASSDGRQPQCRPPRPIYPAGPRHDDRHNRSHGATSCRRNLSSPCCPRPLRTGSLRQAAARLETTSRLRPRWEPNRGSGQIAAPGGNLNAIMAVFSFTTAGWMIELTPDFV
jgi:hypothetical protein